MELIVICLLSLLLLYLTAATVYLLVLAVAYLFMPEVPPGPAQPSNRFAILVPAHNEELLIGTLCNSLLCIDYPAEKFLVHIVADNCSDNTVAICQEFPVEVLVRHDPRHAGKGQALAWALEQIPLAEFDAVFIVDADNVVDPGVLRELNRHLNAGEQAIQCCNSVGNRSDSWFTQLLYVARVIGNQLYHESKYRLGLSSYLMGNGLCFRSELLQRRGWTAFSTGEDWEYYTQLVAEGTAIGFAAGAQVFHQESSSLNQATSQRLRWSSGRFKIARTLGWQLFRQGVSKGRWWLIDASLPLIFPNNSLHLSLTLASLVVALVMPASGFQGLAVAVALVLLAGQALLFLAGAILAGEPWKVIRAAFCAPVFLVWKSGIDLLCFTGLYQSKKWVRTRRHQSPLRTGPVGLAEKGVVDD